MKKFTGAILFFFISFMLEMNPLFSQVSINNDGAPPDTSAMLDIQSGSKGLLIPRIDFNNRPSPAPVGLMIFVTANGPYGNNALYMYNGVAWSVLAYANLGIGQYTGGGVVFYIDPSGIHGLISSTMDQTPYAMWGCIGTLIGPGAQNTGLGTGDLNMAAILGGCADPGIAASICDTLTLFGYTDWYLPAIDELDSMYVHRDVIGNFNPFAWYWSSTEHDDTGAFIYDFFDNFAGWTGKDYGTNVRCIRKF